jgi:lipopolysaccharide transport system ATP-binding protein
LSKEALERFAAKDQIEVVPDTAFGISRLIDRPPSADFAGLCKAAGLTGQYIIVQATSGLDAFMRLVKSRSRRLQDYQPIGPVLGDSEEGLDGDLPRLVRLNSWPQPLLIAELISRAAAVVGHSYHLAITALACGVPVFSTADLTVGKYSGLAAFDTIFPVPCEAAGDSRRFVARLGKIEPSPSARAAADRVAQHWDRIAAMLKEGETRTQAAMNQFWQSLPTVLEAIRSDGESFQEREQRKQIDELKRSLARTAAELASRDKRIAAIYGSPSWRITAPLRFLMRKLKSLLRIQQP